MSCGAPSTVSDNYLSYWDRWNAYVAVFKSPRGEEVLQDLAGYCNFLSDTFSSDPLLSAYMQGQRSVILEIMRVLKLTPADIDRIVSGPE